jgi:hypothetical protein
MKKINLLILFFYFGSYSMEPTQNSQKEKMSHLATKAHQACSDREAHEMLTTLISSGVVASFIGLFAENKHFAKGHREVAAVTVASMGIFIISKIALTPIRPVCWYYSVKHNFSKADQKI